MKRPRRGAPLYREVVKLDAIDNPAALENLRDEWSALVDRAPAALPFQRPQWLLPWWRAFGSGHLHALTFREGKRLAGLLVFFIHECQGRRQVTIAGNGITDYLGLVAEARCAPDCARSVFDYLRDIRSEWDVCDWQDLRADSPLVIAAPRFFNPMIEPCVPCTSASLPSEFGIYEASLPHGLHRTIRRSFKRLEQEGTAEFQTLCSDRGGATMRELFRLHETRWAPKGGTASTLDSPVTREFLLDASQSFAKINKLRLYTMHFGGELISVICSFFDRGSTWGYVTGMDPAFSRFSPGTLALYYAMRQAIGENSRSWEFLRGEEEYKFLWGAERVSKFRMRLWHSAIAAPHNIGDEAVPA